MSLTDPGTLVVVAIIALFYLRLYYLRRRKRMLEREEVLRKLAEPVKKRKKGAPKPEKDPNATWFRVANWWVLGVGLVFMCLGLAMKTSSAWFPAVMRPFWWIPIGIGGIGFIFSIQI